MKHRWLKAFAPMRDPARIAQDPHVHRELEGVTHHPWVHSYRHYFMCSNQWSVRISVYGFAVAGAETLRGVYTGNPEQTMRGVWGMVSNAICGITNKVSHASIHYTKMSERLYNRKVHIYRDLMKDPEIAATFSLKSHDAHDEERRQRHMGFLIDSELVSSLSPEERRFRTNSFLRYVFYDHFDSRRYVVLGTAMAYQLGTGLYAVCSSATMLLLAYPARAAFTGMVYWHFAREEKRAAGKSVLPLGKRFDAALWRAAHKPATYSIPFEAAAAGNYAILFLQDVAQGVQCFANNSPVDGAIYMLSAVNNAGFVMTSGMSLVAEADQGDGIDWRRPASELRGTETKSVWREAVPHRGLRRLIHRLVPQITVDPTLFNGTVHHPAAPKP